MSTLTVFTERFNEILSERELKPSVLAALLGVHKNTVCRYARGAQLPNLKMAVAMADYFGFTLDYLLGRSDEGGAFAAKEREVFKDRFAFLMKKFGTNKYRVAKATGLHPSVLYRWQEGKCSPELDSIVILADYFDCSVEYILGRSGNIR